jgi:hypothetical protein
MVEHDPNSLGSALAELADLVPEDDGRLDAVHARVRRRRTRRIASRSVIGVGAVAATIAGLVALQQRPADVVVVPAGSPLPAAQPCPTDARASRAATDSTGDDAANAAAAKAAAGAAPAPSSDGRSDAPRGAKGYGTVVAVNGDTVTIHFDAPPPDQPAQIDAVITPDTTFLDNGTTLASRPTLTAGEHVLVGAQAATSGYELSVLDANPPPAPSPGQKVGGENGTGAAPTVDNGSAQGIKGPGTIVAVNGDSVTIHLDTPQPGQPAQVDAAITADTVFLDHGAKVATRPALANGDHVLFGAQNVGSGYDLLLLEINPDPSGGQAVVGGPKGSASGSTAEDCTPPSS